jgi:hypothetical protein
MEKDPRTFKMALACGLIPMGVGLGIFFSWWIGKAWFLTNLHFLELWGFYWILISLVIVLIGFFMIGALIIKHFRANASYAAIGVTIILLNIPAVIWVLSMQEQVGRRAYIRLYNESGVDIKEIVFTDSAGSKEMGGIENHVSSTIFFYPIELGEDTNSVPIMDSVIVTLKTPAGSETKLFPTMYEGQCERISIGKNFNFSIQ